MKIGIVIGRFQGLSKAHEHMIRIASEQSDKVLVLVGSANKPKRIKNPWSASERIDMMKYCLSDLDNLIYIPIDDYPIDDNWAENVKKTVEYLSFIYNDFSNNRIDYSMFGCNKDDDSYWLKKFPDWNLIHIDHVPNTNATDIRNDWFKGQQTLQYLRDNEVMHPKFGDWLLRQPFNGDLQDEWNFYKIEERIFGSYPYPETLNFCCADVVYLNHKYEVLLIKRGNHPGKGQWALPGGFKDNNETFAQAAARELKEETGLDVIGGFEGSHLFDNPKRSYGITRITKAFLYRDCRDTIPTVVASDDATEYKWVNIHELQGMNDIFSDHQSIIEYMCYQLLN